MIVLFLFLIVNLTLSQSIGQNEETNGTRMTNYTDSTTLESTPAPTPAPTPETTSETTTFETTLEETGGFEGTDSGTFLDTTNLMNDTLVVSSANRLSLLFW